MGTVDLDSRSQIVARRSSKYRTQNVVACMIVKTMFPFQMNNLLLLFLNKIIFTETHIN